MPETVDKSFTYVIIGGGIAGVTCAENLHLLDPEERVLLLTANDVVKAVTNIIPLTKTLQSFDVEEKSLDDFKRSCPNVHIVEDEATALNINEKIISTKSGKKFTYEKIVLCMGANVQSIAKNHPHVLWIRDTESVAQFQSRIKSAKRIVIVGNGGIATEIVYEIEGVEVVWAIKDSHVSSHYLDPGAATFLMPELYKEKPDVEEPIKRRKYTVDTPKREGVIGSSLGPDWHSGLNLSGLSQKKITFELNVTVKRILPPDERPENLDDERWPVYVELSNEKIYGCDFIVSATGVIPNTSGFIKDTSILLSCDKGISVNENMETSAADVYAAGDVCTPSWNLAKHWFQMRLWTQARQMGAYAAKCMWASRVKEEIYMEFCFELFAHATKFFGHKVILLGLFNGEKLDGKYEILLRVTKGKEYIKCIMVDDRMQGAILIGETDLEETFENLILNQMDLSSYGEDLLDPSVDIEDYFD